MKIIILFCAASVLFGCNANNKRTYSNIGSNAVEIEIATPQEHPGKKLMENNCYMCHNPKALPESRKAPSMTEIKLNYLTEDISKEDFINEIEAWTKKPSKEKAKMPDAVEKYGLMPYQFFPENTIRQIADYMFETKME